MFTARNRRGSGLVVVLALSLVVSLCACFGDDDDSSDPSGTSTASDPTQSAPATAAPEPVEQPPPVDLSVATAFAEATQFLYTVESPFQTGVAASAFSSERVAVIRGRVLKRDGSPLPDVAVTVVDNPEFGQTRSRADGWYDLAVNGGGPLTVRYELDDHLPVQRQVEVPWRDFALVPDVVLIVRDPNVTAIDFGPSVSGMQVASGSRQSDGDGLRRATVLFPAGTTAELVQPDGALVPTSTLHVRLTEYTVGSSGQSAMPGGLPPTSNYTYAVELSADEAVAKVDGRDVVFNQPVFLYVENFIDIPVGEAIPAGFYDQSRSAWVGVPNGRVVEIVGKRGGIAELDVDGDGRADDAAALVPIGITEAEQREVAALYSTGTSLWRTPLDHFSTVDCNWPVACVGGCEPPNEPPPPPEPVSDCERAGSIIGCERQTLGEEAAIAGTEFTLTYRSDRVPGRTAEQTLRLSLNSGVLPPGVISIEVEVLVAGQRLTQHLPATARETSIAWDGKDAYGRLIQGTQPVTTRIGYTYRVVPTSSAEADVAWARIGGAPMSGSRARSEITLWQEWNGTIARWDARGQGLGAWTLSAHHVYDPVGRVLYMGDGSRRLLGTYGGGPIGGNISTIVGTELGGGDDGDDGPANEAQIFHPFGLAVGPDGSLYIADSANHKVRRIGSDGIISTVAGNGTRGYSGDGGPATSASLDDPRDVAVGPDGSLFIVDRGNMRVRHVSVSGVMSTVAGSGNFRYSGDGGPAVQAGMEPWGIAVAPDGSIYIADSYNSRVRLVDQRGIVSTFAGTEKGFGGDGAPAAEALLSSPAGVALSPDGSLFIADRGNNRIRRVTPDGTIETVVGSGADGYEGDGGAAEAAALGDPYRIAVGRDGSLYIADETNDRVRWIGPEGIIVTVVGTGVAGFAGDGGPAPQAIVDAPTAVAVGPDGSLFIADRYNHRIRKVEPLLQGGSASDLLVSSPGGSEVYVFSGAGRHLRTLDALTGATLAEFDYDESGRLLSVDEGDGNVTTIERDPTSGAAIAIEGPFGHRTSLSVDANGYLSRIVNPANEVIQLESNSLGLLTALHDARSGVHRFTYDSLGRLVRDSGPSGFLETLTRTEMPTGCIVAIRSAVGRIDTYRVERQRGGAMRQVVTGPSGAATETLLGTDGTYRTRYPDGTEQTVLFGPDPRWGMQAPVINSMTRTSPGGLSEIVTVERALVLADPDDLFSVASLTDSTVVNGRAWTTVYRGATRTLTSTSPAGRQTTATLDAQGRLIGFEELGLSAQTVSYDSRGRVVSISERSGETVRTRQFSYGDDGWPDTFTDAMGRSVSLRYDPVGRIVEEVRLGVQAGSDSTRVQYDSAGNVVSVTPPGRGTHVLEYSDAEHLIRYIPPSDSASPQSTAYGYSADGELTSVTRPDAAPFDLVYDAGGRLVEVSLAQGGISLAYDSADRLTSANVARGGGLAYDYDGSLLTGVSASGDVTGRVVAAYDAGSQMISLAVEGHDATEYSYDPDGQLSRVGQMTVNRDQRTGLVTGTNVGIVTDEWTYNGFGEPTSYTAEVRGIPQLGVVYTRDRLGRIATRTETVAGITDTYTYFYDTAGHLTRVEMNGAQLASYDYDANGNRIGTTDSSGAVTNAVYDGNDRLIRSSTTAYSYSAGGDRVTRTEPGQAPTSYDYDGLGNLVGVTMPNGDEITYSVDAQGRRVRKWVNGEPTVALLYFDDQRPVAQFDGAGHIVSQFVYGQGSAPDLMIRGGRTYRIIVDERGSPRFVVDVLTGDIRQRIDYDDFGTVLFDSNPGFQPFGYAGGIYDADTGLVLFGARDYDPETGTWTASDPILFSAGDTNLYAYAMSDPINRTDPSGLAVGACGGTDDDEISSLQVLAAMGGSFFDSHWAKRLEISLRLIKSLYGSPIQKPPPPPPPAATQPMKKRSPGGRGGGAGRLLFTPILSPELIWELVDPCNAMGNPGRPGAAERCQQA